MNNVIGFLAPFAITKQTQKLFLQRADKALQDACACVTAGHDGAETILCRHVASNHPNVQNIVMPPGQEKNINFELVKVLNVTWTPLPGRKVTKEKWCQEFESLCDSIYILLGAKKSNYPAHHYRLLKYFPKVQVLDLSKKRQ